MMLINLSINVLYKHLSIYKAASMYLMATRPARGTNEPKPCLLPHTPINSNKIEIVRCTYHLWGEDENE
jgi:hypothetical protein